jgi:hypothetical protein
MAGQGFDPAQSLDPEQGAPESKAKAVLFDPSAYYWGPACKFVQLPLGPNGANRFVVFNATPRPDGGE